MAVFLVVGIVFSVLAGVYVIKQWFSKDEQTDKRTKDGNHLIFDGEFSKGVHDHLYALGQALVSNAIFLESSTSLASRDIRNALVMLTKRFPMLRMKFHWIEATASGKTRRYLIEMDCPSEIEFLEEDLEAEMWPGRMEEELNKPFDGDIGPLWRVIRLREQCIGNKYQNTFLFTYHHSVSDAISLLALFEKFLEYLDTDVEFEVESMPLLPPLQDILRHETTLSWWDACLLKLTSLMKSPPATRNIYLQAFPPVIKKDPFIAKKTCVIARKLTLLETSQLIQQCKANKSTVTGALMAAAAITFSKIIQGGEIKSPLTLEMGAAVNIRDYCRPAVNRDQVGCFVSFCLLKLHLPQMHRLKADFWSSARQLSGMIKESLNNKEHLTVYKMLKYNIYNSVGDFLTLSRDDENMGRRNSLTDFSNVGRFQCKTSKHKLLGIHFAVAQHFGGALFSNSVITVNDQLFHTLVYSSHVVSHDQAEEFIDSVYDVLRQICFN